MNRNVMIIMNPKAGKGNAKTALFTICDQFNAMEDQVCVFITQYANHAKELSKRYGSTYDILVCIGGDGTWNEVVSGLLQINKRPQVCYLPSGTVNDFASTLKLSKNASKMMEHVKAYHPFPCDMGTFNQRCFTYVAAFGIFTEVSYTTPQNSKNAFGRVAYFLEGIKQITKITKYHVRVEVNDDIIEDDFIFGCVTNSKYVAGFTNIDAEHTELDDGLFEMLLIQMPNNPLDIQNIIAALLKHEVNEKWMYFCKCSHVRIQSKEPIPWTLDGEDGGEITECSIHNNKQAINILI